tara:strand:- start:219 stop:4094 length:3876 start_codon:yes stop_codon:yes gene_type:complete
MGWFDDYIVDPIKDFVDSAGDFLSDPLGALEDWTNAWLNVMTLGAYGYAKDQLKEWAAGLVPEQDYQDRQRTIRSSTEPQLVIYGENLVGGQLIYIEDDGKDNTILWMCYHIAGHEVEEIDEVRANGVVIATAGPSYNSEMNQIVNPITGNNHFCWRSTGDRGSAPLIPTFNSNYTDNSYDYNSSPPNWTLDHIGEGQAFVWIALAFDKETFGDVGLPKFTFKVRGKNDIYDPRTGTTGYTDNQALIVRDVLVWDRMFGASTSEIDEASFIAAANIADELVASGVGTTEKRYTVNGTFKIAVSPMEIVQSLCRAGASYPVYSQGLWSIVPGAYQAPVMDLDESDFVGGLTFQPGPGKASRHNVASGTYIDPDQEYKPVGFQELYISSYVNQDLEVLSKNYDFPFANSPTLARRLAKIDIERNRFGLSCTAVFKFKALQLTPGDRINLYNTRLGWSPKVFRIEKMEVSFNTGVKLELREDAPEIYSWSEGDALALTPPPALSIPSGISISSPTNLNFSEEIYESVDRSKRVRLNISWLDQPSADAYEIQYRLASSGGDFIDLASYWQDNQVSLDNVTDAEYQFRIRSITGLGRKSTYYYQNHTVDGFTAELPTSLLLNEIAYEPRTPDAVVSTVVVNTTAPADANYGHSFVQYKKVSDPDWITVGPTDVDGRASFVVKADGSQYQVRVSSVSTQGIRSGTTDQALITVSNSQDIFDPEVAKYLPAPRVNGLELLDQGNDTVFTGKDAKFEWRKTSIDQWLPLGSEGYIGASGGNLDQYFKDYQVEVWAQYDNGTGISLRLVRTEWVVDPYYTYTYEKNAEDYKRKTGQVGAWRSFELRVYCRGRLNQVSEKPASLSVDNPPPGNLQGLRITPGFKTIDISYTKPDDLDYSGVSVWVSEVPSIDPNTMDPVVTTSDTTITLSGLSEGTQHYVILLPFDEFGRQGAAYSTEYSVKTLTGVDLSGLSSWAYLVDQADRNFIEANLGDDAVPSQKIVNVTAAKITTGTLNATETITAEGLIRSISGTIESGLGPRTIDGTTYLHWALDTSQPVGDKLKFGVDELGNVYFDGTGTFGGTVNIDGGTLGGSLITTGYMEIQTGGSIRSGKTGYSDDVTLGWWLGDDAGDPKLNIGDLYSYLKWDGSRIIVQGDIQTSPLGSNKRVLINSDLDVINLYDDLDGSGQNEEVIRIGRRGLSYNDLTVVAVGNTSVGNNKTAISGRSHSATGVSGVSQQGAGVQATSTTGPALRTLGGSFEIEMPKLGAAPTSSPGSSKTGFKSDSNGDLWWWNGSTWAKLN